MRFIFFSVFILLSVMNAKEEIEEEIAVIEIEMGLLATIRRSPNPKHSVVAGRLELKRRAEIDSLKDQLKEMGRAA